MTKVSDLLNKGNFKAFSGTSVKFKNTKGGTKVSRVKTPKHSEGTKLDLR